MLGVEAASLFVSVNADTDKATRGLSGVNQSAEKTQGFLKGAASSALGFGGAMLGIQAGAAIFGAVKDGAIGMNAELETSTMQFTTLMGDADKAKKHVEGLFDFAAKTPFETGPIIEASRLMETFGGAALNSKKNLTTFGDAAAATGQPINEVAFWMSRAYAAIQAGKPWGEAAQRLGEMGIVTPKVRQSLEDMQASGAKGPEVWNALTGSLDKFGGSMEKQAGTFDGMMSTLSDGINIFLAKAGRPLFEGLKVIVGGLNDLMSSPGFNGALDAAMQGLTKVFTATGQAIGVIADVLSPMITLLGSLFSGVQTGQATIGTFTTTLTTLGTTIQTAVFGAIESVIAQIPAFADAFFQMATKAVDTFVAAAPLVLDSIMTLVGNALTWVMNTGVPMAADALGKVAVKFIDWVGPAALKLAGLLPVIAEKVIGFVAKYAPVVLSKLAEWGLAFIGWIAKNVLPRLPGALVTIGSAIVGWIAATAPVLVGKMLGLATQMVTSFITFLGTLPAKFVGVLGQVIAGIPGAAAKLAAAALSMGGKFVSGFINGLVSLPGKIAAAIRRAFSGIKIDIGPFHISASGVSIDLPNIKLPGFATGAYNLPNDMIAQVHKGEMIIPADLAERMRGGSGFGSMGGRAVPAGGGDVFVFEIGSFYGTESNIQDLSEAVATQVRLTRPKRTVVA